MRRRRRSCSRPAYPQHPKDIEQTKRIDIDLRRAKPGPKRTVPAAARTEEAAPVIQANNSWMRRHGCWNEVWIYMDAVTTRPGERPAQLHLLELRLGDA